MSTAFGGVKSQLSALLPVISAAGIVAGLKNTTDAIDNTAKAARKFGVDFNELRQIQYAASIDTSLSTEQLGKSLQKMSIFVSDVGEESEKAGKVLGLLNIEADDLRGKSLTEQFGAIADGLASVSDENDRLAAAQDIFGKSGADLIPLLEKGAGSIRQLADEHQRLVGNLTDEQTSKIENANDQLTRVGASMTRIAESAAVLAAGPLERVAKGLELLGGAFGGDTLTESVLAINKVDPKVRQRVSSADIGGGGFMSDIASGNFTNAFWREQFTAIEYMRARNEQASMRATGGVDANGVVVRLAPESIDALNSGEIQSERRTRLD
jgi:hypothetical protein